MMMLGWLVILGLGAVLAWQALLRQQPHGTREHREAALRILEERYARGEIGRDEFEERRRTLAEAPSDREQGQK